MLSKNPFTLNIMNDILNKPLYFLEDGRLNVSNIIDPYYLSFFDEYYGEYYDEIVYYEYDRPLCPNCENSMNSNGSRRAKPNKWEGIRKKTIYLSSMWKNTLYKFRKFYQKVFQLYSCHLSKIH